MNYFHMMPFSSSRSAAILLLIVFLFAGVACCESPEIKLVVRPFDHQQVYETGASGYTWYRWTLNPDRSDNPQQALEWLFKDQNLGYIRNAFDQFSVSDGKEQSTLRYDVGLPGSLAVARTGQRYPEAEWQIESYRFEAPNSRNMWVFNQAKKFNPDMKLMCYGHLIPKCFRKNNGNKNWQAWPIDRELPRVEDYLAKWMFANLVNLKLNEGTDVDILDIFNEADAINFTGDIDAPWNVRITQQRDGVAWLLHSIVPRLREWVADTKPGGRNRWHIKMPRIMAPSCVDTTNAAHWLKFWHDHQNDDTYPWKNAWANIDILSYHQYVGGYKPSPYETIDSIRGQKPVMQSEMHTGDDVLKDCPLPDVSLEDDLQASLLLAHFMSLSLNHGASVYDYYMGISALPKPESLLRFENRTFTRRKIYYAHQQLTSTQPRGSHVVRCRFENAPDGFDAFAFHHEKADRVFVNLCNRTNEDQKIRVALEILEECAISNVAIIQTNATMNQQRLAHVPLDANATEIIVVSPANSISTLNIAFTPIGK